MYEEFCAEHGGLLHIAVHEAAHAVAAIDRGIKFFEVEIRPRRNWRSDAQTGVMLGGVHLTSEGLAFLATDRTAAAEFALSGHLGEEQLLGHALADSFQGDINFFRTQLGATDALQVEDVPVLLGAPLEEILRTTRSWVQQSAKRIRVVAGELLSERWALTEADVRRTLAGGD